MDARPVQRVPELLDVQELLRPVPLQVQQVLESGTPEPLNMIVPIDILKPILEDLLKLGRPNHPPRPWQR